MEFRTFHYFVLQFRVCHGIFLSLRMKRTCEDTTLHGKHRILNCKVCGKGVNSNKLGKHMLVHNPMVPCPVCGKEFRSDKLSRHAILCKDKVDESTCNRYSGIEGHLQDSECYTSVSGYFKTFKLDLESSIQDYDAVLDEVCLATEKKLKSQVEIHPVKAQLPWSFYFTKYSQLVKKRRLKSVFGQYANLYC